MMSRIRSAWEGLICLIDDSLRLPGRMRLIADEISRDNQDRRQLESQILVQTARTHHRIDGIVMMLNQTVCEDHPLSGFTVRTRSEVDALLHELQSNGQLKSWSQYGEDLIIKHLFDRIGITQPTYLDLGAHSPTHLSNTALLHQSGSRGVNVEADPKLIGRFHELRPDDVNLNVGVGVRPGTKKFYRFRDSPALGTFDDLEVTRLRNVGKEVEEVVDLEIMPVNEIIRDHFGVGSPDFLTIDIEGVDLEVLESINFQVCRPKIVCVEINAHDTLLRFIDREFLLFHNQYFHFGDVGGGLEGRNAIYIDYQFFPAVAAEAESPAG